MKEPIVPTNTVNTSPERFQELGYLVVPALVSRADASQLHELLGRITGAGTNAGRSSANERRLIREQPFLDLVTIPHLLEAVRVALGDDMQLLALDSLETPPGAGRERDWHADFRERIPATVCVNCGLYLQDMTDEVGPLRVIPGSHRWDRLPSEEEEHRPLDGEQTAFIDAGDCVVFDAQLWHTGSRNASDRPRRAIFAYYGKFWMKRMDAYYQTALPEALTSVDADPLLRQLFGVESAVASVHGDDYNASNTRWR
jgi:ectoine hydroxylase-related dioxygenase (phytanoyl-CoA dioxygenase family)